MKRKFSFLILSLFVVMLSSIQAQDRKPADSVKIEDAFKLDFTVPEIPAFRALNIQSSNALRPSEVKEFAVMLSPFYNNGKVGIPKNFALEFAPWKMASGNWTLGDYKKQLSKRIGYHSGFSIGAVSDTTAHPSKLALGYRLTILSKNADPLRSRFISEQLDAFEQSDVLNLGDEIRQFWMLKVAKIPPSRFKENHQKYNAFLADMDKGIIDNNLQNDPTWLELRKRIAKLYGTEGNIKGFSLAVLQMAQNKSVTEIMKEFQKQYWNASRLDFGMAWVGESTDSSFSQTQFSSLNLWTTYGLRLKEKGQLLIGGSARLPNTTSQKIATQGDTPFDFTGNLRLLIGNDKFRFFGETQLRHLNYGKTKNGVLLNLGTEVRFSDRFWLVAFGGVENLKDRTSGNWFNRLVSSLDLRYGFN